MEVKDMYTKGLSVKLDIRLTVNQLNKLCELAEKRKINVSQLLRYIIDDYLRRFS